jgi:hypothetical protein
MANDQLFRNYNITDSELTVFTQHICDSMTSEMFFAINSSELQLGEGLFRKKRTKNTFSFFHQ